MIAGAAPGEVELRATWGDLLILGGTVAWAVYTIVSPPALRLLGALRATAWSMAIATAMLAPFLALERGFAEIVALSVAGLQLAFLSVACSGVAYLGWFLALERLEASRVAAFLYLEPLVTFAAAVALLGEPIGAATVAGGLMVLAGVLLVERAPGRRTPGGNDGQPPERRTEPA